MDQPESIISPQPDVPDSFEEELGVLRKYFVVTLAACVIVTSCFNVFLWRQDRSFRAQNDAARKMENDWGTYLNAFLNQLLSYSAQHPDLNPILTKHGVPMGTNLPVTAPAQAVAPKATAPAAGAKK